MTDSARPGSARPDPALRPTEPLPGKPAGYLGLESYSSLRRLWVHLEAAARMGRRVSVVRGDTFLTCRRRISGYTVPSAGGLLDVARVEQALDEGLELHPALIALMSGDALPLQRTLTQHYDLHADFVLAFTRGRELILRPELRYRPSEFTPPPLPLPGTLPLVPRRFGRDELGVLLGRACGLA